MPRPFYTTLLLSLLILPTACADAAGKERTPIYTEKADGPEQVARALEKAQFNHKHVLIQWGANWCGWCYKLHEVFEKDEEISEVLRDGYEVVLINTDHNKDYVEKLGTEIKGVPFLTVLDAEGNKLTDQDTGSLETGPAHDVPKVLAFLNRMKPETPTAREAVDAALKTAKAEEKNVLLTFGAAWCGWCHRFEDYLLEPEAKALLEKAYVLTKIDTSRMAGAEDLLNKYKEEGGGIPWFAILDANGEKLITSSAPWGNIGYPLEPEGAAYFAEIIEETAPGLSEKEHARLSELLEEKNKVLRERRQ
jgi:thioredoxin-related protein